MTTARELLETTDLLLLDFDGPVTKLLPPPSNAALTDAVRAMALDLGVHLDADEMTTTDHLAIIRAANRSGMDALIPVEREATRLEVEAAGKSPITLGVRELLQKMHHTEKPVIIVTNNSPDCVGTFLHRYKLSHLVESVLGRDPMHIDRMKPSAWMLNTALSRHPRGQAVMIGDSVSDVTAANAAEIICIGLAKNWIRAKELLSAGSPLQISSLTQAVTEAPRPQESTSPKIDL